MFQDRVGCMTVEEATGGSSGFITQTTAGPSAIPWILGVLVLFPSGQADLGSSSPLPAFGVQPMRRQMHCHCQ